MSPNSAERITLTGAHRRALTRLTRAGRSEQRPRRSGSASVVGGFG